MGFSELMRAGKHWVVPLRLFMFTAVRCAWACFIGGNVKENFQTLKSKSVSSFRVRVSTDSPLRILYIEVVGYLSIGLIRVFIVLHFHFGEPLKKIDHYFITASKQEIWS
jgi:hypothetical protein